MLDIGERGLTLRAPEPRGLFPLTEFFSSIN